MLHEGDDPKNWPIPDASVYINSIRRFTLISLMAIVEWCMNEYPFIYNLEEEEPANIPSLSIISEMLQPWKKFAAVHHLTHYTNKHEDDGNDDDDAKMHDVPLPSVADALAIQLWWNGSIGGTTSNVTKLTILERGIRGLWCSHVLYAPRPVAFPLTDSSDHFLAKFHSVGHPYSSGSVSYSPLLMKNVPFW
jgi:hypothetical protein